MIRFARSVGVAIAALALGGCATLFSGTKDVLQFQSDPSGATVLINGIERGVTPLTTPVTRNMSSPNVTLQMDGFEPRSFYLVQAFNTAAIADVLCLPFVVLCGGVDALTGALMKYDQKVYTVRLKPQRPSLLVDPVDLLTN